MSSSPLGPLDGNKQTNKKKPAGQHLHFSISDLPAKWKARAEARQPHAPFPLHFLPYTCSVPTPGAATISDRSRIPTAVTGSLQLLGDMDTPVCSCQLVLSALDVQGFSKHLRISRADPTHEAPLRSTGRRVHSRISPNRSHCPGAPILIIYPTTLFTVHSSPA